MNWRPFLELASFQVVVCTQIRSVVKRHCRVRDVFADLNLSPRLVYHQNARLIVEGE